MKGLGVIATMLSLLGPALSQGIEAERRIDIRPRNAARREEPVTHIERPRSPRKRWNGKPNTGNLLAKARSAKARM